MSFSRHRVRARAFDGGGEGFLNYLRHHIRYAITVLVNEYDAKEKLLFLLREAVNVLFTGTLLWYVVEHRDIVSFGLAASLLTYYFTFVVDTIAKAVKSK